jgi:hypothetical protein
MQVEEYKLKDFKGDYEYYLEQNEDEAAVMEEKAEKAKKLEQENTKVRTRYLLCACVCVCVCV